MQDDLDRADTDRTHEGYQQRYEKERRASYGVVIFGLLAFVAIIVTAYMHHMGIGMTNASTMSNIEPASGTAISVPAGDAYDANTTTNTITNTTTTTNTVAP